MTAWISGVLDDLCEVEYGTRVTRKRDGGTKYPVYGGGGATFNLDDFNRQDQMIVSRFAMSEECVRFVPGKFFLNDSGLTVRTRDSSTVSQEFLDQQLLAKSSEIYSTARGTAQKNMDMTLFRSMELSFPVSLDEQKRIVALLDAATTRVTELTACYEQACTYANNLFASALQEVLEDESGWPTRTLNELATIATGKIDVNAAVENGAFPFFTCSRDVYKIDDAPFQGKAILVAGNGDLNVKYYEGRFNAYQRTYFLFSRDEKECFPRFIYWFLENHLDVLRSGASGSTIKYIRMGDLADASVALPPLEEQKRIVARLDLMRAKTSEMVAAYDAKLAAAKNLRQSILEAAFAGDL